MKVLFVCRQNVGRSQMAKALYNHLTHSQDADAAGTHVTEEGQTLMERKAITNSKNFFLLDVMKDIGIDVSHYKRRAIMEDDMQKYDLIIAMTEPEDTPQWLMESSKYMRWGVKDPRNQDYATTAEIRDNIKQKVVDLIRNDPKLT